LLAQKLINLCERPMNEKYPTITTIGQGIQNEAIKDERDSNLVESIRRRRQRGVVACAQVAP